MRRDRRSEDCVLELSRSHPAGVICRKAGRKSRGRRGLCHQADDRESKRVPALRSDDERAKERSQQRLCHTKSTGEIASPTMTD
jgi:hypothetical protein